MPYSTLPPHIRKLRAGSASGIGGLPPRLSNFRRSNSSGSASSSSGHRPFAIERDYRPSKWSDYFTEKQDIKLDNGDQFRIYLHEDESARKNNLPLLLLLHGGGFSSLTWACFVKSISELCHVRALAIDLRGHGSTKVANENVLNLENFIHDIDRVLLKLFSDDNIPEIILMGHSMGGAIAVHYSERCQQETIAPRIVGLIVIDVVEGTAKDALSHMQQVLRSRPSGFKSIEFAIEWYVRSGQVKNVEAAKISMPGQIKSVDNGTCATDLELTSNQDQCSSISHQISNVPNQFGLSTVSESENVEESNKADSNFTLPLKPKTVQPYVWRINLSETEKYWSEWFNDLSKIFLSSKGGAKMLILAGVDRLDGPMTVGQMQGKFQMQILPKVGHTIQEDDPDSVAHVVAAYLVRHRFSVSSTDFDYPFPSC